MIIARDRISTESEVLASKKHALVVVSMNPWNFHRIVNYNRHFQTLTQLSDIELTMNASIFMPALIEEMHEKLMEKFIKRQKREKLFWEVETWLKQKNGIIVPVFIKASPYLSDEEGLSMIGIITPRAKVEFNGEELPVDAVYLILADQNDKVKHFSQNLWQLLER